MHTDWRSLVLLIRDGRSETKVLTRYRDPEAQMFRNTAPKRDSKHPCHVTKGVFTPVDRLLYSETGIKIITLLLFILGAVCFHTAKFLNGPKLSRASKLSSHWSKFHGAGMTINDSFGKRGKQTLSHFGPFRNFAVWKQTAPRIKSNIVIILIPVSE